MDKLKIKIILGSTRQGRFSEKPGTWLLGELQKRTDIEPELLDLRDYKLPFFDEPQTPSSKKEPYKNPEVMKWTAKIAAADGFVVIAPEYNHGYPAVLKNALDYAYQEWNNKPVGFVSYGSALGARSVEQLREVAIELQMAPIRNAIHIPIDIFMAARADGAGVEAFEKLNERATGLADQLVWWGKALKTARA